MNAYDIVTEAIIAKLESGVVPWRQPWKGRNNRPTNLVSLKPYSGINLILLASSGYASPYWVTFKQAKDLGGNVRKGEHGTRIIYFSVIEETETTDRVAFAKYYTVFNLTQCDGIAAPVSDDVMPTIDTVEAAEAIAAGYRGPSLDWTSNGAWYRPLTDHVSMPPRDSFRSASALYATLFHEFAHSTGHTSRLNRPGVVEVSRFGSESYSKEELIAEMAASFLMADAGMANDHIDQSAAYCQSWIKALKGDTRLIVSASSGAHKAAQYILVGAEQCGGAK